MVLAALIVFDERYARPDVGLGCIPISHSTCLYRRVSFMAYSRHEVLDSNRRVIYPQSFFANCRTFDEYRLCVATAK